MRRNFFIRPLPAGRACELTDYRKTMMVGTLAAAQAEAGRFDDAISTAQKAIALAQKNGEPDLPQRIRRCWNFTGGTRRVVTFPKILSPPQIEFSFLVRENWRS